MHNSVIGKEREKRKITTFTDGSSKPGRKGVEQSQKYRLAGQIPIP